MFYNSKRLIPIIFLSILYSCYHKELNYSFDTSYGGVVVGSSYYYLANVSEFRRPKSIRKLPDGGIPKGVRHLFGLFKTDSLSSSTVLITRLGDIDG